MLKWEYTWFQESWVLFYEDKPKYKRFENGTMNGSEYLSYLGGLGWELVGVCTYGTIPEEVRYLLKRPIENKDS